MQLGSDAMPGLRLPEQLVSGVARGGGRRSSSDQLQRDAEAARAYNVRCCLCGGSVQPWRDSDASEQLGSEQRELDGAARVGWSWMPLEQLGSVGSCSTMLRASGSRNSQHQFLLCQRKESAVRLRLPE